MVTEDDFVDRLHQIRELVGNPSLRRIAELSHVSRSHVSVMFRGQLGSWETTRAVLRALGVGDEEMPSWHRDWVTAVNAPAGSLTRPKGRAVALAQNPRQVDTVTSELVAIRHLLERLVRAVEGGERHGIGA